MRGLATKIGIVLATTLVLAGCAGGGEAHGPGAQVEQFFTALNDGDYAAARAMYNAEAAATVNDPEFTPEGAYREWADMMTKKGSIETVRVVGTDETETAVNVSYDLVYTDGSNRTGVVSVTQENGAYRLGLIN